MAGTVMKAGNTRLTLKDTWTPNTEVGETTTRGEGAVEGAKSERRPAQIDPGGKVAGDEPWTQVATVRGITAEGVALGTATAWRTSTSEGKEEEEEEGGIGAGTALMTTLHPQNLPESWSHWTNLSMFCWWRIDPVKVKHG